MMIFILSQIVGLLIFLIFNVSLFLFIKYKRNQMISQMRNEKLWNVRLSYFVLCLFCLFGISFRALSFQDGFENANHQRLRKDQVIDRANRN